MTLKRKRIGIIILCALFVLMGLGAFIVPLVKITSVALSGNGTEDSPYLITNADDLKVFRDSVFMVAPFGKCRLVSDMLCRYYTEKKRTKQSKNCVCLFCVFVI